MSGPAWQQKVSVRQVSDPLAVIYNETQWRLSRVSALYNLQYSHLKLKQYASKLRQAVVSTVSANTTIKYTVVIERQPDLKYSEEDSDALMITISAYRDNIGGTNKVVYSCILLSWGTSVTVNNAVYLPYLIERGELKLASSVKTTLQKMFDCNIHGFSFNQHQLLQFGFKCIELESPRNSAPFNISFQIPRAQLKENITLAFEVGDIHIIWSGVKEEAATANISEQVTIGYKILQNQIYHMMMLNVSVFDVCSVSLPYGYVKSNGTIRMKTPEVVNCMFTELNEMSHNKVTLGSYIVDEVSNEEVSDES